MAAQPGPAGRLLQGVDESQAGDSDEVGYLTPLLPLFEAADAGLVSLVTSAVTLLEVLVVPYRSGDNRLAERYATLLTRSPQPDESRTADFTSNRIVRDARSHLHTRAVHADGPVARSRAPVPTVRTSQPARRCAVRLALGWRLSDEP